MTKLDPIDQSLEQPVANANNGVKNLLDSIASLPINSRKTDFNKIAKQYSISPTLVQLIFDYTHADDVAIPIPEPSKKSYSATQLAVRIYKRLNKYITCTPCEAKALTLWILSTWFVEYVKYVPYLFIDSPEPECGKTQTLVFLEQTCRKAAFVPSLTAAVITRVMTSDTPPTLLVDEADAQKKDLKQCKDFINAGYQRAGKTLKADLNDQRKLIKLNHFGNKAFAGIDICGIFPSSTISRSIVIRLRKRLSDDNETFIDDISLNVDGPEWERLRRALKRLELDYCEEFEEMYLNRETILNFPKGIRNGRLKQIWRGIFTLAHLEQKKTGKKKLLVWARQAMRALQKKDEDFLSEKQRFLKNLSEILSHYEESFITLQKILSELNDKNNHADWGWCDYNNGTGIRGRMVSNWIKSYGFKSERNRQAPNNPTGWYVKDLKIIIKNYR